jgi:hypothetical protein
MAVLEECGGTLRRAVVPGMGKFLSIGLGSEKLASGSVKWKYIPAQMSSLPVVI